MGLTVSQAMEKISAEYAPDSSPEQLMGEWRAAFREIFSEGTEFTPGGGEFITQASRAGVRIGIASAMSREAIDLFFESKPEYRGVIQAIVTCDDVPRCKPAPDVFLECARALGCDMADVAIFEDSVLGLQGARAANPGHGVVCILSDPANLAEKRSPADYVTPDFRVFLDGAEEVKE